MFDMPKLLLLRLCLSNMDIWRTVAVTYTSSIKVRISAE